MPRQDANMKKTIIAISLLFLLLLNSITSGEAADFRKARWGMTKAEVIATEETEPQSEGNHCYLFNDTVLGRAMCVHYCFVKNQLVLARYELADKELIDRKYIKHYESFQSALKRKYGAPVKETDTWRNGAYFRDDKSQWGTAVSTGKLTRRSTWQTGTTDIELLLTGGNFNISCGITYQSRAHAHLVQQLAVPGTETDTPAVTDMDAELKNF